MKKHIILLALIATVTGSIGQTKNVLFLGNSYTYVNDLPGTIGTLANSFGDTLTHDQNTPGGYTMQGHSANATSLGKIAIGGWDFVAIQSQSQEPSFPPSQVETDVYPYAEIICDSISSADDCAEPLFFMTWGRKNGDASNCPFYPPICTYGGMQQRLRESYLEMANDNDASVSPVGAVWKQVRDSLPALELYSPDESHPSVAGTYVAACTFYAAIWRKSPVGSSFISTLSASDAHAIQLLAERVVLDSLTTWRIGDNDVTADFSISNTSGATYEFTSNTTNADSISWEFGDGNTGMDSIVSHTYAGSGIFSVLLIASNSCMADTLVQDVNVLPTGINEHVGFNNVLLYPNPARDQLTILAKEKLQEIRLFDQSGKLVLTINDVKQNPIILDISTLASGNYVLRLSGSKEQILERVVKIDN
jgi:hypothetical protein